MKKSVKTVLGVGSIVLLSSGIAGVTTYRLMSGNVEKQETTAFEQVFQQNPNYTLAAFNSVGGQPVDLTRAAESSVHAVVHIRSTKTSKIQEVEVNDPFFDLFGDFFGNGRRPRRQVQTPERVGFGSGVIISEDGYIVTNNHVIEGADEISVKLNDNREFKGRVIGTDPNTDLALVKIEGKKLPTMPVGDSDALKLGEWVLAVGNPFNLNSTVTAGIVSAKARSLGVYGVGGVESFIQTDAAINQGNSGGALVNSQGELVGINSVLSSPTGAYAGYGFAIPSNLMKKVISDLKEFGVVQRAMLGISGASLGDLMADDVIDRKGTKLKEKLEELGVVDGVWVREIVEGGSAAGADIQVDDVIVGIDSREIHKMADLHQILASHRPGDKIEVTLVRDKKKKTISMTLKNEQGTTKVVKNTDMNLLGAAFKNLSDEEKQELGLRYGIEVTGVKDGRMKDAGIRKGFIILKVNGKIIESVETFEQVMKAASKSLDQVLFISGVFPSGKRANYAVDLMQE